MRIIFLVVFAIFLTLQAQSSADIMQIEQAYRDNNLSHSSSMLHVLDRDPPSLKAAKNYFLAVLNPDIQSALLTHSINFTTFPREYYGMLSGIQLISVDYINYEFEKALLKIDRIDTSVIPEALFWKAKIAQTMQRYDEAIQISEYFIIHHADNHMHPNIWLIILECHFYQKNYALFDKNFEIFSAQSEFADYKPYLLFLSGMLSEDNDIPRAGRIYSQIVTEFPTSQYRVQADDRLFQLRVITDTPPPIPPNANTQHTNIVVSRYEDLTPGGHYIQFGVFDIERNATNYVATLSRDRISTFCITKPVGGRRLFAVVQGPFPSQRAAQDVQMVYINKKIQTFIFRAE
jgi:tetratricopeptide (TPR) repeat protein